MKFQYYINYTIYILYYLPSIDINIIYLHLFISMGYTFYM